MRIKKTLKTILCLLLCLSMTVPAVELNVKAETVSGNSTEAPSINIDTNEDGIPDLNVDTDGDGVADVNIDTDNDGIADANIDSDGNGVVDTEEVKEDEYTGIWIDLNGDGETEFNLDADLDGKADLNIDLNGDEKADLNVDLDGNGEADVNIDTDNDGIADTNVDADGNGVVDTEETKEDEYTGIWIDLNGDGEAEFNLDTDLDRKADLNIDLNGDEKADINIDTDEDGIADLNVDTDADGIANINIDLDGDGIVDLNFDADEDGIADFDIDTDGDGVADTNVDANRNGIVDTEEEQSKEDKENGEDDQTYSIATSTYDLSFDSNFTNWTDKNNNRTDYIEIQESDLLKIEGTESNNPSSDVILEKKVTVEKNTDYVLSGKIKVDSRTSGSLQVRYYLGSTVLFAYYTSATDGWIELSEKINTGNREEITITIYMQKGSKLKAYISDMSLVKTSELQTAERDLLEDVDFSDWTSSNWSHNMTVTEDPAGTLNLSVDTVGTSHRILSKTIDVTTGKDYILSADVNMSERTAGAFILRYSLGNKDSKQFGNANNIIYYNAKTVGTVGVAGKLSVPNTFTNTKGTYNTDCVKIEIYVSNNMSQLTASIGNIKFGEATVDIIDEETPFDSGVLMNGAFKDKDSDGVADNWTYVQYNGTLLPETTCADNGITITATNSSNQRITVQQDLTGLVAGGTYQFTGTYNIASRSNGYYMIEVKSNGKQILQVVKSYGTTSGDVEFDEEFTLPEGIASAQIRIDIWGSGGAVLTATAKEFKIIDITPPFDSGILINGSFKDKDLDGIADNWTYDSYGNTLPETTCADNGITITATNSSNQRITVQQELTGLTAGGTYQFTGSYNITSHANGYYMIDVVSGNKTILQVVKKYSTTSGAVSFNKEFTLPEGVTNVQVRIFVYGSGGAVLTATAKEFRIVDVTPLFDSGLLVNGGFADRDSDGIADNWIYSKDNVTTYPAITHVKNGITISATREDEANQRITIEQELCNLTPGEYQFSGIYSVASYSNGYFAIEVLVNGTDALAAKYKKYSTVAETSFIETFTIPEGVTSAKVRIDMWGSGGAELVATAKEFKVLKLPIIDFKNGSFADSNGDNKADQWEYYSTNENPEAPSKVTQDGLEINAASTSDSEQRLTVHQTLSGFNAGDIYRFTGKYNISSYDENANKQFIIRYVIKYTDGKASETIEIVKHQNLTDGTLNFTKDIVVPEKVENIKVEIVVNPGAVMTVTVSDFKLTKLSVAETMNNSGIIKNPEFKGSNAYNITNWAYSPDNKKAVTYSTAVNTAEKILTLTANNTTEYMSVYQKVVTGTSEVPENAIYKLTGKMKATDFAGSTMIRVRLDDEAGGSLAVVKQSPTVTESTNGWVDVEYQFEVPSAYYKNATDENPTAVGDFKVELYVGKGNAELATGSVSFKDLEVTKVSDISNNVVTGAADNTLFSNGGFERTYDGLPRWWSVWESTGGLKVSSDRAVYHEGGTGSASLHIENVTEGKESRGSVHQTITDIPAELQGQSVKISQWIKASNFTGTGFTIRLQYKTNSGAAVDLTSKYVSIPENVEDTGWQLYEYILDLPSNDLKQIKLEYLYDECVGDVWVDDLSVTTYIKATGITPSKESVILNVSGTEQLTQTLAPSNATIKDVTYASSNTEVATVSASGLITAVKEGTATVKVSHVDGAEKEIAVLVADETFSFNETIAPISTQAGVAATGTLPAGYTYTVAAKPQYGAFVINGTNYNYYPDAGFTGNDTVVLAVENASGAKTLVKVQITVGAASEAPVFDDFIIATSKNTPVTGGMVATDATTPSNQLVFTLTKAPSKGTLTITGDSYTYTPETGFAGYVTAADGTPVEVTVTDKDNNTTTAEVTIYVSESQEEIAGSVKDFVSATHRGSYLLADDAKFESIARYALQSGSEIADWLQDVKAEVDPLLDDTVPFPAYQCSDGVRLDTQGSKDVVNLAFMYRVTKAMNDELVSQGKTVDRTLEKQYLNRAWMELENLCNPTKFPDWHPSHLLDVAMTANGVAIAYDWLYDYLESAEKTHSVPDVSNKIAYVESALYKNALVEGKFQYEDDHMFVTNGFNWNYVCNGGFATAALALVHCNNTEYEALAAEVLQLAYKSIQNGLPQYAPEGDSIEGVSYWDYGTRYLVSFLACVKSATGSNPFSDTPGLKETALYPIYLTGKDGSFNYSDNDTADAVGYLNLWLAEAYNEPAYAWYHKYYMSQNHKACIYDLLYYNAQYYNSDATPALDSYYSAQAVTTMRKDYTDANSAFVGFKGGITGAPHGDLDIGTFIYDIYGIRWAADLGKENYNMGDYWNLNSGSLRWGYYRKDASGHNTLVINPKSTGENQKIGTYTGAVETKLNGTAGGYTILDMTPAYQNEAASVKRGVAFINRSQVLVRDEYILKSAGEIYWQMHTEADISISADGKIATLTQDGKSIEIRILDDSSNLKFETMAAGYYDKSSEADTRVDASNAATGSADKIEKGRGLYKKLYIKASDVQTGSFSVLLTPADEVNPEVKVLADWSAYDFSKFVNNKKPTGGEAAPPEADPGDSSSSDDKKEEADKDDKDSTDSTGSTLVETVPAPQKPAENTTTNTSGTKTEDTDVTDEKEEAPVEEKNEVVLETEITVEDNVAVIETPSEEVLEEILGDETEADVIVIDVTKEENEVTAVELPVDLIEAIAEAAADEENTVDSLEIKLPAGTVTIDAKTLSALVEQAEGDSIRLVLEKDTEHRLNEKQTKAVADYEVHEFIEAYFICTKTEKRISDFKGGVATLSIPFEIPAGKVAKGFKVWYVDDEGGMEELVTWYEDEHLFWEVGHFSDFVIIYDETAEAVEDSAVVDTESADGATIEEPAESAGFPWWIIAVVVVVVAVVFVLKRKKDEGFED